MARAKRFSINCFWRLAESVTCNKMPVWGQTSSQNQFEFVTSIKSNTNHSHLKFKFWNCICLDKMSPDEENKRLSVRLKKKERKKNEKKKGGGKKTVLFISVIINTADSFGSCSRRTVNSWRTDSVSDAGSSLVSEQVFSHLLSPLPSRLQVC